LSTPCRHRTSCRLCDATDLIKVLSLASTPPANAFVSADAVAYEQARFPLDLWFCRACTHLQLLDVVDPSVLFADYVYVSGTSPVFVAHFERYARDVSERFALAPGDLVVDVGSNDGSLLGFFKRAGQRVLGVDPARDIARRASESGIETLCEFFSPALAGRIRDKYGSARVVTANNVFAHADDLHGVVEGVRALLAPDGVFVFEVSYLADVVEKTLFDTIYHEHLDYHSVRPLVPFFARHGMQLIETNRTDSHGGSLHGVAQLASGVRPVGASVVQALEVERRMRLDREETFVEFGRRIDALGERLRELLSQLRAQGKRIAGFGAPAKATTLMHHFGLGRESLDFIVDDSPLKQGLFTPGLHVPVVASSAIAERRPDYLLILAWNFARSIIEKQGRFAAAGGRFIIPVPDLEVI
jgi:SAM-dependent methyltransferase